MTERSDVLGSLAEAEALAERILAAIDASRNPQRQHVNADRERVASDLAGLRDHEALSAGWCMCENGNPCPDATRYAEGLLRTAALYGVAPTSPSECSACGDSHGPEVTACCAACAAEGGDHSKISVAPESAEKPVLHRWDFGAFP